MSDASIAAATTPPVTAAPDIASLLQDVALFRGIPAEDLDEFAAAFAHVSAAAGTTLWRQGAEVDGLHVLLSGHIQISRRLPGERELDLARLGPGAIMGEIPLLGGGPRSASARTLSPCSFLFLDRAEFHARMCSRRAGVFEVRRRIVAIACDRLRAAHAALGDPAAPATTPARPAPRSVPATPKARSYVARLPFFRRLHDADVTALLHAGRTLHVAPRSTMVAAGASSSEWYVVLNGAVEELVPRAGGAIRVGFAGPGIAFGYLGLLDGRPASATWVTRERTTLLAIGARELEGLLRRGDERSRAFAAAIEHDLIGSLATAERAMSHLAGVSTR